MKILVCGGRTFDNKCAMNQALNMIIENIDDIDDVEIISGHCKGADILGEEYANEYNISLKLFPANWKQYGRAAGPIRNKEMVDYIKNYDCCVVAFWDGSSKGTKYTIDYAKKNNIIVYEILYNTEDVSFTMNEGVRGLESPFEFDFENDEKDDIVKLTRREIYSTKLFHNTYFYEYKFSPNVSKSTRDAFLSDLKHGNYENYPYKNLINDCIEDFYTNKDVQNCNFDAIIQIPSSKPIVSQIIDRLDGDNIIKLNKLKSIDVDFDYSKIKTSYENNDAFFNYLHSLIERVRKEDEFHITPIPAKYRRYLTSIFELSNEEKCKIPIDGNILIVDDIITSCSTITNCINMIRESGFQGKIHILSLFRNI